MNMIILDEGGITGEHELPNLRKPPLSSLLQPMQVRFQRNENSSRENPPTKNLLSNMKCLFHQASWIVLQCVPGSRSGAGCRVSGVRPRWPSRPSQLLFIILLLIIIIQINLNQVAILPISTLGGATMSPVQLPVDVPVGSSSKLEE